MKNNLIKDYYKMRMRQNDLLLTTDTILYYNWRAISFCTKIRYFISNRFNLKQAKFQNALDRLSILDPEGFKKISSFINIGEE